MAEPVDINVLSHIAAELIELRTANEALQRVIAEHVYFERHKAAPFAETVAKLDVVLGKYKAEIAAHGKDWKAIREAAGLEGDGDFMEWVRESAALRTALRRGEPLPR